MYVMEGSIMGGSIIIQMLKKKGIVKGVIVLFWLWWPHKIEVEPFRCST